MKKISIIIASGIVLSNINIYDSHAESLYYTDSYTITYETTYDNTIKIINCSGDGESLFIPDTIDGLPVTEIDSSAFVTCTNLTEINVSYENEYFSCENGMLIKNSENLLIKYTGNDITAEIPYGTEVIGDNAFFGSKAEYINIPETISYIGDYSFSGCTELKKINIPDSVQYMGAGCFLGCPYLEEINLPNGISEINNDSFYACPSIQILVIPESVNSMGNDILSPSDEVNYNPVIYGFYNSIVSEYADENNIKFRMMGDVNNDSYLNASDASEVLAEYALISSGKNQSFDKYQYASADLNGDGITDASDASLILSAYAKISSGG